VPPGALRKRITNRRDAAALEWLYRPDLPIYTIAIVESTLANDSNASSASATDSSLHLKETWTSTGRKWTYKGNVAFINHSFDQGGNVTSAGWQLTLCDPTHGVRIPVAVW